MKNLFQKQSADPIIVTLFAFTILLLSIIGTFRVVERQLDETARATVAQEVYLHSISLSNSLNQKYALIYGLSAYAIEEIEESEELTQSEFMSYAFYIFNSSNGIRNIAIAPDTIVKYVYPYEENKSVLGYNPTLDERPNVRMEVQRAIVTKKVVLSQPYELLQGGIGLIARQAVFIDDEYWGLTNLVIDIPTLMHEAGVNNSPEDIAIAFLDQQGNFFYGDESILELDPIVYEMPLAEDSWTIMGMPTNGWRSLYQDTLTLLQTLSVLLLFSTTIVIYQFTSQNIQRKETVDKRTSELQNTEKKLREDIAVRKRIERENKKLLDMISQQRNLAETLSEITLLFTSHTSIEHLLDEILIQIHRLVPFETANIALVEGDQIITKAALGYNDPEILNSLIGLKMGIDDLYFDSLPIRTQKPILLSNVKDHEEWAAFKTVESIKSFISIPICYGAEVLGLIRIDSNEANKFTEADLEKLQPVANSAALALYNARLFEQGQREIAERKKAEAQVRELNNELEQRVEKRTADLQRMNKELEAFAYSISHDLRAPVRAIKGITQLFEEEFANELPKQGKEYLTRIAASSEKMNRLIEGLLTLSYMGKQELTLQTLNISRLSKQIFDEIIEDEPERQFELEIAEGLEITGDKKLVEALLTNLISNAVKFTRNRETASIKISSQIQQDRQVIFIQDNGMGFDMAYTDKLFEPFNRLNTETEVEGTGIGLAIVKRVVQRHHGEIWVEASPKKGSTFYFYFSV